MSMLVTGQDNTVPSSLEELCLTGHERPVWPIDINVKIKIILWLSTESGRLQTELRLADGVKFIFRQQDKALFCVTNVSDSNERLTWGTCEGV
jgi:hypothetical protein